MFEDIVKSKFEGVDIGTRDITSEIKSELRKGLDYGIGQLEELEGEEIDTELRDLVNTFFDQSMDELAQMYLDSFTTDELITMLDFELTPLAKKKLNVQFKIQKFMTDGLLNSIRDYEMPEEDPQEDFVDALRRFDCDNVMEEEGLDNVIWDSKE